MKKKLAHLDFRMHGEFKFLVWLAVSLWYLLASYACVFVYVHWADRLHELSVAVSVMHTLYTGTMITENDGHLTFVASLQIDIQETILLKAIGACSVWSWKYLHVYEFSFLNSWFESKQLKQSYCGIMWIYEGQDSQSWQKCCTRL